MDCRRAILDHVKQGGGTRQGKRLRELPYNTALRNAQDFLGHEDGLFLPAHSRYTGRLYSEIPLAVWKGRKHHVLIISGIYGVLLPEEPIQRYSLDLRDSSIAYDIWRDTLSLLVGELVKRKGVGHIIDGIGEDKYRNVFDWEYLQHLGSVTHILGSQNAGPSVLRAIGEFLGKTGLQGGAEELINLFASEKGYPTRYETVHFLQNLADARSRGLPVEEIMEGQSNAQSNVPLPETPPELVGLGEGRFHNIEISCKALDQWKELPADIRSKIPRTLSQFIVNPNSAGLKSEQIRSELRVITRIRINDFYRIHLLRQENGLTVFAIGPHRLMGIG